MIQENLRILRFLLKGHFSINSNICTGTPWELGCGYLWGIIILSTTGIIPQYLFSTFQKTPMLLPKAGTITAQSRDHVAQFPLLCLTWLNSTMWWKWKWYRQLLEAALKREGVSFPFFLSFLLAKTHTWGMKLDRALWNVTEKVHNGDDRVMGDCVPTDCELSHWPYVINASGRVGGGINIYLLSFCYQAGWMLNQTCSYQIHRMQRCCQSKV